VNNINAMKILRSQAYINENLPNKIVIEWFKG